MNIFICDLCGDKFKFKVDIIIHLIDHQSGSIKKSIKKKCIEGYKCEVCQKSFTRKESYRNHNLWHTGKSPHKCFVCGKTFTRDIILKKHIKSHTKNGLSDSKRILAKFSCVFCPKIFTRKEYLRSHMSIHTQESQHKCLHCKKMFTRKDHLVSHIRIHTGETPFKCEKCSKPFVSMKSLKAHCKQVLCKKAVDFVCYICSKSFTRQSSVTNHINNQIEYSRTHSTGGNFKCKECSKCFLVKPNLIFHMKSHKP